MNNMQNPIHLRPNDMLKIGKEGINKSIHVVCEEESEIWVVSSSEATKGREAVRKLMILAKG